MLSITLIRRDWGGEQPPPVVFGGATLALDIVCYLQRKGKGMPLSAMYCSAIRMHTERLAFQ